MMCSVCMYVWPDVYCKQTRDLSKILHCRIFRPKFLHRQFHLISTVLVIKTQKNEWKWRNLHRWQKFYTAAGSDGIDKFHLCVPVQQLNWIFAIFGSSYLFPIPSVITSVDCAWLNPGAQLVKMIMVRHKIQSQSDTVCRASSPSGSTQKKT